MQVSQGCRRLLLHEVVKAKQHEGEVPSTSTKVSSPVTSDKETSPFSFQESELTSYERSHQSRPTANVTSVKIRWGRDLQPSIPTVIEKFVQYSCKTSACMTGRCSCKKRKLKCTKLCNCCNCANKNVGGKSDDEENCDSNSSSDSDVE